MRRHPLWRHRRWEGRRPSRRFVRRLGCAFAALIGLAALGASTLLSMFVRMPEQMVAIGAVGILVLAFIAAGFTLSIRRVSGAFREQDRLRRQLMADVAHELRTPLAILQGRIEGLADGVYPRDDAHVAELLAETRHLSRLVADLGTLANAETGELDLKKEWIEPAELIRSVAGPRVEVGIRDPLPQIEVDPVRIREVLLNLVANALAHTDGAVIIEAHADRRLVIRVIDHGSGIPADELPYIFDRLHKGRESGGSGLGLAIARKFVVAHGGTIDAESEMGRGTTVIVTLPL